jgi:hypothetical protein
MDVRCAENAAVRRAPVLRWIQSESMPLDVTNNMARVIPIHCHG